MAKQFFTNYQSKCRQKNKPAAERDWQPGIPHAGFFSPSFLMRETSVLGLILSNSAAPPRP